MISSRQFSFFIFRSIWIRKIQCDICFSTQHIFDHQQSEAMKMTLRIVCVCVCECLIVIASGKWQLPVLLFVCLLVWCLLVRCVLTFQTVFFIRPVSVCWMSFRTWASRMASDHFAKQFHFFFGSSYCWRSHKNILQGLRKLLLFFWLTVALFLFPICYAQFTLLLVYALDESFIRIETFWFNDIELVQYTNVQKFQQFFLCCTRSICRECWSFSDFLAFYGNQMVQINRMPPVKIKLFSFSFSLP